MWSPKRGRPNERRTDRRSSTVEVSVAIGNRRFQLSRFHKLLLPRLLEDCRSPGTTESSPCLPSLPSVPSRPPALLRSTATSDPSSETRRGGKRTSQRGCRGCRGRDTPLLCEVARPGASPGIPHTSIRQRRSSPASLSPEPRPPDTDIAARPSWSGQGPVGSPAIARPDRAGHPSGHHP
jgi:hypothetical protein